MVSIAVAVFSRVTVMVAIVMMSVVPGVIFIVIVAASTFVVDSPRVAGT